MVRTSVPLHILEEVHVGNSQLICGREVWRFGGTCDDVTFLYANREIKFVGMLANRQIQFAANIFGYMVSPILVNAHYATLSQCKNFLPEK